MKMFEYRRFIVVFLILVPLLSTLGCVRRRFTIVSNPPGAVAYLDNVELGKTPISRNFMYYGKRELRLVKPGYETHTQMIELKAPWYQWPGVDFVSEVLVPGELTDHREFRVDMKQQSMVSHDTLIANAEQLKAVAHSNGTYRINGGARPVAPEPNADGLSPPVPVPGTFTDPNSGDYPEDSQTPAPNPPAFAPAPWDPPNPSLQSNPPTAPSPYDPYIPNSLRTRPEQQLYPQPFDPAPSP